MDDVKHGFDTTHFGSASNFAKLLLEFGLFAATTQHATTPHWAWCNARGLVLVAQCNPLTGQYAPGNRENEPGFASYVGLQGPPYEVAACAAAVRRYAVYIKEERAGVRAYI